LNFPIFVGAQFVPEQAPIQSASSRDTAAPVVAAFDLGSNTIKMTVARRSHDGAVQEFLWRSETVRLGQNIESTGKLAADRIDAAMATLVRFAAEARSEGATRFVGVATEATRIASNGADFLERVHKDTGIEIQTITGEIEAELTFLGLQGMVRLDGNVAVADIGGASTELILARDGSVKWSRSFPLGSGRSTDRFVEQDPPTEVELARCRDDAKASVTDAPLANVEGGRLIVVGGTGEYLDRLLPVEALRDPAALEQALGKLRATPSSRLASELGIPEARARVLPAGVAIVAGIADVMAPESFEAAPSGIRRGLLISAFAGEM